MSTEIKTEPFNGEIVPYFYKKNLVVGSGRKDVGICTLWTKEEVLQEALHKDEFSLRGPLYSQRGVEYMVRNCLLNPCIRNIFVSGSNANNSADSLFALMKNGVGEHNEILGLTDSTGRPRVFIDHNLPKDAIDEFRDNIKVYDLRDEKSWRKVSQRIREAQELPAYSDVRKGFPETLQTMNILPSEKVGIRVERTKIADAWVDMLHHIRNFGTVKPTDKGRNIQELASLHVVINEDPSKLEENFPSWLPIDWKDIETYLPVMLNKTPPLGVEVAYTYGSQLQNYDGLDQIKLIEDLVKNEWYTKRAIATTWHLPQHLVDQDASAPCLVDLMFLVQDDKLMTTAHFRSHDMFRAWLQNVYGLRTLQGRMAKNIGIEVGSLEVISNSAHLWQDIIPDADRVISNRYDKLAAQWTEDPRGNFLLVVEKGKIEVRHVDLNGNPTGKVFNGLNGQEIYKKIIDAGLISMPGHAAYIAWELKKATDAIESGKEFIQDRA